MRDFYAHLVAVKCKATAEAYCWGVKLWQQFLDSRHITVLETTNAGLLDDFVKWALDRGISPGTLNTRIVAITSWLEFLRRRGMSIPQYGKPALPKVWKKEPTILTMDQIAAFFSAADQIHEPIRTALTLFPLCGLRSDEMSKLRLDSISMQDGWVVFSFQGKGRKVRQVPLLKQGNPVLRTYLLGWRKAFADRENPWLFPGHRRGEHLKTRTIRKWVDQISKDIDAPEMSPHAFRATYLTMLDQMGISPFKIAQLAGHSNLRTTSQHYVRHSVTGLVSDLARVQLPTPIAR